MGCWPGGGIGARRWSAGLAALVLAGCGDTDGRVPVKGTVTLDGQSAAGLLVRFHASRDTKGNGGYAFTDEAGRFTATTLQARPGLYPGEYAITLAPREQPDGPDSAAPKPAKVPGGYADPERTPLRIKIDGPQDALQVQATSAAK